jgi:hypothetical protein
MDQSARFGLPFLAPGQAQKEWFHNEALQRIDMLLCPVVEGPAVAAPPASPAAGACYIVGVAATGAWAGQDGAIAAYSDGGWRFVAALEGAQVLDKASGQIVVRRSGAWETGVVRAQEVRINGQAVVRERQPAVPDPLGGAVVDGQCRAAVAAILATLRTHGLIA